LKGVVIVEDNYSAVLYDLVKNGSAWLVSESMKLISRIPFLRLTKTGMKISAFLESISQALLTEEGTAYGLPMLLALAYFIFPLDTIPDFIIPFGFVDDCAVLAVAAKAARKVVNNARKP